MTSILYILNLFIHQNVNNNFTYSYICYFVVFSLNPTILLLLVPFPRNADGTKGHTREADMPD